MNTPILRSLFAVLLIVGSLILPAVAKNRLVDMVPQSRSGETNQDAEPTITVDPNDNSRMAGSAFTWDNLIMSPMVTATAPIYVSTDRGDTWALAYIVPSKIGAGPPTGDITLSFSSTLSSALTHTTSWLYAGTLSAAAAGYPMTVLRAQDPFTAGTTTMTTLDTRSGNVDQPHTISKTSTAGQDKLYVGFNKGYGCIAPSGRSSTLDVSQDAAISAPTFTLDVIEARNTACQDGFAQVPAAHLDGTVYAAFIHNFTSSPRLVVVRDDNWGAGAAPFSALTATIDGVPGSYVTTTLTLPSGVMGQNRLGASNVSIAVDPGNSDRVYVAWGDGGFNTETIHVRRSINRGVDWSDDLLTVTNALNPEVAINSIGTVGVLYQRLVSGKWETHLVRTTDTDATAFNTPGILLANQLATSPTSTNNLLVAPNVYLGDYASLVSVGRNFVGMFSASNYPDKANFMTGVKFQREVNWTAHKLYTDAAHTTEVAPSIDPFFFEIEATFCDISPVFCNICKRYPEACYPIYDPWWRFKCPACSLEVLVRPGDEIKYITLFDSKGREVGEFKRLKDPVVIKGMKYTHGLTVKAAKGVSYVLKAEVAKGKKLKGDFNPEYTIRQVEAAQGK